MYLPCLEHFDDKLAGLNYIILVKPSSNSKLRFN
jgi:hypothetical protein